jgi:NCS2 family nucleobase:cation symporter-2
MKGLLKMSNLNKVGEVGLNEPLSIQKSLFLGLQSILACNLFLGPIVIIGVLKLDAYSATKLIAATFLICGIATVIQSGVFMKYPIIQGMSFATIGAVLAIAARSDMSTALGSVIPASIVLALFGYFGIFSYLQRKFIPPIVSGTVVVCIGVSLVFITWNSLLSAPGETSVKFMEAGVSFVSLITFIFLGHKPTKLGRGIRMGSVIYAMIIGTIFASFFGDVDISPVLSASWFSIPGIFPYGPPKIEFTSSLVMTFILLVVLVESLGSWFTTSLICKDEMDEKRVNIGVVGEAIGCIIAPFFGSLPVTSYGSNPGVLALTKVYSRWAAIGAGALCIAMALCPKLMALIAIIPSSVIWGAYSIIAVSIMMSGFDSVKQYINVADDRSQMIIGLSVMACVGANLIPPSIVAEMPLLISYIFGSAIVVGALAAIILNLVLPKNEEKYSPILETNAEQQSVIENI